LVGLRVAVATPLASVVACVTTRPPELAANATVTPCTRLLLVSRTNAVIVAVFDPSEGICGRLVKTLTAFEFPLVPELTATTVVP
jgi:pyrimidine deaminase RibD-like protein